MLQREPGETKRLADVVTGLVHQMEEVRVEQRAERDVDADRSEIRDELRDAKAATRALFRHGRERQHANRPHVRLLAMDRTRCATRRHLDSIQAA